jgi:hypothetical protein
VANHPEFLEAFKKWKKEHKVDKNVEGQKKTD